MKISSLADIDSKDVNMDREESLDYVDPYSGRLSQAFLAKPPDADKRHSHEGSARRAVLAPKKREDLEYGELPSADAQIPGTQITKRDAMNMRPVDLHKYRKPNLARSHFANDANPNLLEGRLDLEHGPRSGYERGGLHPKRDIRIAPAVTLQNNDPKALPSSSVLVSQSSAREQTAKIPELKQTKDKVPAKDNLFLAGPSPNQRPQPTRLDKIPVSTTGGVKYLAAAGASRASTTPARRLDIQSVQPFRHTSNAEGSQMHSSVHVPTTDSVQNHLPSNRVHDGARYHSTVAPPKRKHIDASSIPLPQAWEQKSLNHSKAPESNRIEPEATTRLDQEVAHGHRSANGKVSSIRIDQTISQSVGPKGLIATGTLPQSFAQSSNEKSVLQQLALGKSSSQPFVHSSVEPSAKDSTKFMTSSIAANFPVARSAQVHDRAAQDEIGYNRMGSSAVSHGANTVHRKDEGTAREAFAAKMDSRSFPTYRQLHAAADESKAEDYVKAPPQPQLPLQNSFRIQGKKDVNYS